MKIEILCHSSICIQGEEKVIYIDPYIIKNENHNADIIAITHSHYDHFSEEDILKVKNIDTKIIITKDLIERVIKLGFKDENIIVAEPNNTYTVLGVNINTVPAYNTDKKFHPKENEWVGYILTIENERVYIAGDTDITEDNKNIKCDIALVPVGGTYTMNYEEAAKLVNIIKPKLTIPTHYGEIVGNKQDGIEFSKLINSNIKVDIQII